MTVELSHREACWSLLKRRLEMGVSLKLLDGSVRAGFVYAVDPQVPCALILVKVNMLACTFVLTFRFTFALVHSVLMMG